MTERSERAERSEFVVVGAGLLGLARARALALARRGHEVIVIEQAGLGHGSGGSHGTCRIFRLGYGDPGYVSMAKRARELWREVEQEDGGQLLHPAPHLTFGDGLPAVHAAMLEAGAPCELLPAAAAAAMFPMLAPGGAALLEPGSCVIAADRALQALAAACPRIRTGVRVTAVADDGRSVTVRTDTGQFTARTLVAWTSGLLRTAGLAVPAQATLEQVGYLTPAAGGPAGAPIFICHGSRSPCGLPVPGSSLYKIGIHQGGSPTEPGSQNPGPDAAGTQQLARLARQYLPGMDPVPVRTEHCVYDNSPDEDFIVDRAGNVVIGSGTSGHGFKFGPLLGEWLAGLATGDSRAAPPARFALRRFSGSAPRKR
jgi:sarcosine oxidase